MSMQAFSAVPQPGWLRSTIDCSSTLVGSRQIDLRSGLNAARISSTNSFGCSQAAKCVPLGNLL